METHRRSTYKAEEFLRIDTLTDDMTKISIGEFGETGANRSSRRTSVVVGEQKRFARRTRMKRFRLARGKRRPIEFERPDTFDWTDDRFSTI